MKKIHTIISRFIKRNPLYTSINFTGLVIGFVCVVFIGLWIKNELSYDRFHENVDQIYRVHRYFYDNNGTENLHLPYVAPPIAPLLKDEFSEIENITRVSHTGMLFRLNDEKVAEPYVCFAEPDILNIFSFAGLPGENNLLNEPLTAVVSSTIASKYFKNEYAVGKTMEFFDENGTSYNLKVTGVFKDWGQNNHFRPEILISFSTYASAVGESELKDWGSNNYETFALMRNKPLQLDSRLDKFINKQFENGTSWTKIRMEKLADIHLNWYGNRSSIYVLLSIALLILILGSINYINLNTAIYTKRIKEIQIKKVIGASAKRILSLLMLESVLFCIVSLIVALLIVSVAIPYLADLFNSNLAFSVGRNLNIITVFFILSILIGLISAVYPAKLLFVRKKYVSMPGKMSFRNGMVIFQFFVSIALIMSFLTVNKQLNYLQTKNLGLNQENVITVGASPNHIQKLDVLRDQLMKNPNIIDVSGSKRIPSQRLNDSNGMEVSNNGKMEPLGFRVANIRGDEHFVTTYEMKLIAGTNISNQAKDEKEYLVNRVAVERIGWESPEAAIGQIVEYGNEKGRVVGVLENFNYESLHNAVFPIILYKDASSYNRISIRINPADLSNTIGFIKNTWQEFDLSGSPFSYQFIDERFEHLYQSEKYTKTIFTCFMVLAIFIAILGLIGLSLFVMERRTKEIGVRKVNGAKISEVMVMLNKNFIKWVAIAFIIATPIAYYAMNKWLENFAYKTDLSWWIFALAGVLALGVALLTVSWQSWRAAARNPVEALRYE
ncbi:FtsX-like permease family protein [uncultured Draconibacterium sp.]|uniref:ABC transporter permease n=1 Tax=uncultured Draconibacterium sp. TaxID=1573823 RepID=UPI0029C94590|nr:FtsX-like permease family protein [uncultured Draconibacterium sp.]